MTVNFCIGYMGMTHLGICSSVVGASKNFSMLGFSADRALIAAIRSGQLPVVEPGLDDLLNANIANIRFSSEPAELAACDVVYVAPDIPTDNTGRSSLTPVDDLLEVAFTHTRADAIVVVLSQVPPGFTRSRLRPDRRLFYQVETLIFGRAVERATRPERFIVGCADPNEPLPEPFARYLGAFGCPILSMRYESAELAKIAINCCLAASVTTANTLAELCEGIGADWSEIVPALRLDRRIGPHSYLNPGLGIAGGNLERDLATVLALGDALGTEVGVVRAWQTNSRYRCDWTLRTVYREVLADTPDANVGLLGLAYKENTHSTKNSPSLALLSALPAVAIKVYDPVVAPLPEWHSNLTAVPSALAVCDDADALIVMTPWPEFKALKPTEIAARLRGNIVIDPFACLDRAACKAAGLNHLILGVTSLSARGDS